MINTQLISNVAQNLKNEGKTDTKTQKGDEKTSSKDTLAQALRKNLGLLPSSSEQKVPLNNDELNIKLKNLVNKVLDQLFAKGSLNENLIKQSNKLNFAPNFSNEIKFLASEMKKSDIFTELLGKLEQILKPASEVKASNLAPLFKNSGVFFEAKLKDALNPENLPKSFHNLLNAIKSLNSPQIADKIIALATKDLNPKSSLNELKNIIKEQKSENQEVLKNTNFKTLLSLSSKLENFKNYISKNPNLAQSKIEQLANNILKQLNKLESSFKQELRRPESLALKDIRFLNELNQSFNKLNQTLKAIINGEKIVPNQKQDLSSQPLPNQNKAQQNANKEQIKPSNTQEKEQVKIDNEKAQNETNAAKDDELEIKQDFKDENTSTKLNKEEKQENLKTQPNAENESEVSNEVSKELKDDKAVSKEQETQKPSEQENGEQDLAQDIIQENSEEISENEVKNDIPKNENSKESVKTNPQNTKESTQTQKETLKTSTQERLNTQTPQEQVKISQERPNVLSEPRLVSNLNTQNQTQQQVKNLVFINEKTQMPELENLNKELSNLGRKISETLKQLDGNAQNAKINLGDIKNLEHKIEQASKDLAKIAPKNEVDVSNELKNDIKSTLLQVSNLAKNEGNEAVANQASRLLAQIEFNQLMSLANDSINTYLPLFWEDLNESRVIFKRGKKDKFYAQIKLHFAKLGELDILIALKQDKYLDINIMAENKEFRKMIYENAHELKRALSKTGLLSSNFFVGDIIRSKLDPPSTQRNYEFEMGIDKKA